jgi:alpha-galactosidase
LRIFVDSLHPEELKTRNTVIGRRVSSPVRLSAQDPAAEWRSARSIHFSADWRGQNSDPELETEVRILWSPSILYLRFTCRYRQLFVFDDSELNGRRDQLWERDVVEAFLQPPELGAKSNISVSNSRYRAFYKEFEVAPNGMWIDLDISPPGLTDLKSGLTRSVHVNEAKKTWTAELAIPMNTLTANFDPNAEWRANFFRVEGKIERRTYMAWQPTHTPEPNFHVPESFGILEFEP